MPSPNSGRDGKKTWPSRRRCCALNDQRLVQSSSGRLHRGITPRRTKPFFPQPAKAARRSFQFETACGRHFPSRRTQA